MEVQLLSCKHNLIQRQGGTGIKTSKRNRKRAESKEYENPPDETRDNSTHLYYPRRFAYSNKATINRS